MPTETTVPDLNGWINVRDRKPTNFAAALCIVRLNDMGEPAPWQQVLHYDFRDTHRWHENDPSSCVKGQERPLSDWHSVTFWKPLDWPRSAESV